MVEENLTFYYDQKRHLVCIPYSVENLHRMAAMLNIPSHWFHKGIKGRSHYDIPIRRRYEICQRCVEISDHDIIKIIRGKYVRS